MMVIGGSNVSAALDCHQERQDPHVLAARARGARRAEGAAGDRRPTRGTRRQAAHRGSPSGRLACRCGSQPGLFDEELPTEPVTVVPSRLRLERGRRFGDVWLAWKLWQALGLDTWLEKCLSRGREDVSWSLMAAVLVIARFCEPSSELHIAEDWFRRTALDDLLGLPEAKVNDDRLYRALDRLLPHKDALKTHLKERLGTLFKLEYDLLLYDVTSTYFEGQANGNTLAARGYSRDHRSDYKQVCIGLVVSREGFPLGYEVFAGNRRDSTTLQEVVKRMEARYGH